MWDPAQYLRFAGPRMRPALDLLARVLVQSPAAILDLGCGAGNVTASLAARWPSGRLVGLDQSEPMLEGARRSVPEAEFVHADLTTWEPARRFDVIYSNAVLHWVGDHDVVIRRLLDWLTPGGVLAVQMPRNHAEPTHATAWAMVHEPAWAHLDADRLLPQPVPEPEFYHDVLAGPTGDIDLWETTYVHRLEGVEPVAEWTTGSFLSPVLEALGDGATEYLAEYRRRVAAAYPVRPDGTTLYRFRRLFFVAVKGMP